MKSLWNSNDAEACNNDPLQLRVYTSRLIGQDEDLVLHGGGNTSVKAKATNIFGEEEEILYVKGSGWNLGTIEAEGFAPVKLDVLKKMAELDELSDPDMVKNQRTAMINPSAPNPSVEAILHAIIPFDYVDHTHTDAVVAISNTPDGEQRLKALYGERILVVPYVMPGFILAKQIFGLTNNLDWDSIDGIILEHHGVFTFDNDPKKSYEKMIEIVGKAEEYLKKEAPKTLSALDKTKPEMLELARIRKEVSEVFGKPVLSQFKDDSEAVGFSQIPDLSSIASRGPLTPDHIIRTKRTPVLFSGDFTQDISNYAKAYQRYFDQYNTGNLICLDKAPRWAVWPNRGTFSFGTSVKNCNIIADISAHTRKAIYQAEQMGGWTALPESDLFEMEYWVLEQEKLKKDPISKPMQGKIALVTGAASGIGKACVERLLSEGAVVAALDIDEKITQLFPQKEVLGIQCDLTSTNHIDKALYSIVSHFGGLDYVVSNAGIFPKSHSIEDMNDDVWKVSMNVNLNSHQQLLQRCIPLLKLGFDPSVVLIASKNVPAPGPGASAYSVAKAGLTQLGRIAALELGKEGIRVNMLHPNAVYDTAIWTDEVLEARAKHYGLTVEQYKTNNVLKTEVTSSNVAELAVQMLGPVFSKTTGAQIPIDGGNERII